MQNNLQVIKKDGVRVLTTSQLAEVYETSNQKIRQNFSNNRERYEQGKHFFALEGTEKMEFINLSKISTGSRNAKVLHLWTEKGALLIAKSLNTEQAWNAYSWLVDEYYRIKEEQDYPTKGSLQLPETYAEALRCLADTWEEKQALQIQLNHATPKIEAFDKFIDAKNLQSMNEVAKCLGVGRNWLFKTLRDCKILLIHGNSNVPYQRYIDAGYFIVKENTITHFGFEINTATTWVTAKGVDFIYHTLKKHGLLKQYVS
ncbi:hypothetical protein GJ688_17725 [Heliobacillus mobilis]|uniref:Phage antirepressor protein YoqD, KilAC domain n=1 Tax=Heliobacterium mobile TaxID=28064 RepID=A0A6I3SP10_HELMO|nr:phage antirepressor KilAC domain-containing protein [Heliobacterium mobile]MTV50774.1 hypothetical protein [Heliobacterium mobile]